MEKSCSAMETLSSDRLRTFRFPLFSQIESTQKLQLNPTPKLRRVSRAALENCFSLFRIHNSPRHKTISLSFFGDIYKLHKRASNDEQEADCGIFLIKLKCICERQPKCFMIIACYQEQKKKRPRVLCFRFGFVFAFKCFLFLATLSLSLSLYFNFHHLNGRPLI